MSAKHTPGPWKINRLAGIIGAVVGGVVRKHPNGSSQDQLFMVCGCRDDNGGNEAQEANARLIAAAPELLLVTQGFRRKLATYVSVYPGDKQLRRLLDECDAAIIKAGGAP